MKKTILLFVLCAFLFDGLETKAQVLVNEYSCSNLDDYYDNHSDFEDWIELYNMGSSAADVSGFYLSDDLSNPTKWKIPTGTGCVIPAFGTIVIYASGRDLIDGPWIHAGFKLQQTKNSEYIILADAGGLIIDSLNIKKTKTGSSRARITDGDSIWAICTSPTFNASNAGGTYFERYAEKPDFNLLPGFYPGAIDVVISDSESTTHSIHYTTDGSPPSLSSPVYSMGVHISSTSVLKAATFSSDPNVLPSFIEFNTYFISDSSSLPVVSIAGDSLDILANGYEFAIPIGSFEYFDVNGIRTASSYGEFNSHGQDSWANDQRSLDFVSRDEMGYTYAIKEKLFSLTDRNKFQRVILRAAGDDNYPAAHHSENAGSAHLRDAYIHNLCKRDSLHLDYRAGEKCLVYINGEYWGVYDLRENPDDHDYTDYNYGQGKYDLQFIETWGTTWAEYGGNQALDDWENLYDYILTNDLSIQANFDEVAAQYDYKSLVDYVLVNSMTVCSDWLNYNTGWWRGLDSSGTHLKWGYILWDNDATFGFYINYTGIPDTSATADPCNPEGLTSPWSDPEGHIAILNELMENEGFRQYYISRYIDLMNNTFSCDNMLSYLESQKQLIEPEMDRHATRWTGTYSEWLDNYNRLYDFISRRCNAMPAGIVDCWDLTGPYDVQFNVAPNPSGQIKINSLTVTSFPYNGVYYGDIDILVKAEDPSLSYVFKEWTAGAGSSFSSALTDNDQSLQIMGSDNITAVFKDSSSTGLVAQNESVFAFTAYPTLMNDKTDIVFSLPENSIVDLRLYDEKGAEIIGILQGKNYQAGEYHYSLNMGKSALAAGNYYLTFSCAQGTKTVKLVYQR